MYTLYRKSELWFSLILILIFSVLQSISIEGNKQLGVEYSVSAVTTLVLAVFLYCFIRRNDLKDYYGFRRLQISYKHFLYFVPLLVLISINLWNGVKINLPVTDSICYLAYMMGVGFVEEVLFRGFLFRALAKDNMKMAVIISSVTFGLPLLETLKSKGYKIGLISNCHSEEAMVIKQSILFPYFDAVCLSYDEGIKKPDHRIFERCMEKLCVDAADCLYVGDGGSRELETAREIGMHPVQAVWYLKEGTTQPTGRMREFTNIENPLGVIEIILQTSDKLN